MTTLNNSRVERKSLANEIDRLDNILDGLDEALAGAVEMAVRQVVGHVVKEAVESTIKEVLSNPDLIRAVAGRHAPVATVAPAPKRTLKEAIKEKFAWLWQKAKETASLAKRAVWSSWSWCLAKVCGVGTWLASIPSLCKSAVQTTLAGFKLAWQFRKVTAMALAGGVLSGLVAYFAGPLVSSALCGIGGAAPTVAGLILWPIYRLVVGENNQL